MTGIPVRTKTGPRTYTPAELVLGGQFVEARAAKRVGVAGAGTLKCLGVVIADGINPEALVTDSVITNGRGLLNAAPLPTVVAVAYAGDEVPVKYAAAAAFGDKLKVAANGTATPLAAGDDFRMWVATCTETAGVAANGTGLARIV